MTAWRFPFASESQAVEHVGRLVVAVAERVGHDDAGEHARRRRQRDVPAGGQGECERERADESSCRRPAQAPDDPASAS